MKKVQLLSLLCAVAVAVFAFVPAASATPWKFGVLSDTQWVVADDGKNPYQCAADIINQANAAFIAAKVQFVIAVGDLADEPTSNTALTAKSPDGTTYTTTSLFNNATIAASCALSPLCSATGPYASGVTYSGAPTWGLGMASEAVRAISAQALYNAGIGFFPFRGNHDDDLQVSGWFTYLYPQTQNGLNNATPADVYTVPNPEPSTFTMPVKKGSPFTVGSNFSSPTGLGLTGLSYAFSANNATFVLIDQFTPLSGTSAVSSAGGDNLVDNQQTWINGVLSTRPAGTHAFVMSHKGLITEDHVDVLLGTDPSQDSTGTNAFINALVANNVRWYINGHDHMHDHSRIYTTDLANYVTELTCASDSNKFYTPAATANDVTYNVPAFGHTRQVEISQDLYYIPYYIVTVDGPKVQIDYYAVNSGSVGGANITTTPTLTGNWAKRETFGYSLNGHEFMVPQGSPYTTVQDSIAKGTDSYGSTFYGTSAAILSGTNGSTVKDKSSRKLTKALNTGWAPLISGSTISDIFTLWGMNDVAAATSDTYSVSVSYNPATVTTATINAGHPAYLATPTKDANGNITGWVKSASGRFVLGPWNAKYPLGYYGLDTSTNTAWAVVNNAGDFAVIQP